MQTLQTLTDALLETHRHRSAVQPAIGTLRAFGLIGGVAGLVLGLAANPATAWFAVFEVGIPSALLGGLLGLASGARLLIGRFDVGSVYGNGRVTLAASPHGKRAHWNDAPSELDVHLASARALKQRIVMRDEAINDRNKAVWTSTPRARRPRECDQLVVAESENLVVVHGAYKGDMVLTSCRARPPDSGTYRSARGSGQPGRDGDRDRRPSLC